MNPSGVSLVARLLAVTDDAASFIADYFGDRLRYDEEVTEVMSQPPRADGDLSRLETLKSEFTASREFTRSIEDGVTLVIFGLASGCAIELLDAREDPHVRSADWHLLLPGVPRNGSSLAQLVVPEHPGQTFTGIKWESRRWGEEEALEARHLSVTTAVLFFAAAVHERVEATLSR